MKATIDAKALSADLALVCRAVSKRTAIPIIACVKIEADKDSLLLSATDLDVSMLVRVPAEVAKPGTVVVSAEGLTALVKSHAGAVALELDGELLSVSCGKSTAKLPTLRTEDYPTILACPDVAGVELASGSWLDMLRRVYFVAKRNNDGEWHLRGVKASVGDGKAQMWATDRGTIIAASVDMPGKIDGLIPNRLVELLMALDSDEPLTWKQDERRMHFECGRVSVSGPTLDGTYPDIGSRLKPGADYASGDVKTSDLASILRRVVLIANGKAAQFSVVNSALMIAAESHDMGSTTEQAETTIKKPVGALWLNAKNLSEFVATVKAEQVAISIGGERQPVYFDADGIRYVMGPVVV